MPPTLKSVVIDRSESEPLRSHKNRQPSPLKLEQRKYDDGPLPIKASDHAPLKARIVSRVFEGGVVTFELKIGDTVMNGIGLEEVLDYVSPYHLEEYENEAFKEEEEMLRIADEEDRRLREEEHERRKQRAKNKGVAVMQDKSTSEDDQEDATEYDAPSGKHGRPRPSYKKDLLKVRQRRRRRKRDPVTGELLPRSDDDEGMPGHNQQDDQDDQDSSSGDQYERKREPVSMEASLPIRRRRKRDPVTKDLMPLDSMDGQQSTPKTHKAPLKVDESHASLQAKATAFFEKSKRPRRRRHPLTNELMPLGWQYDPEAEKRQKQAGIKVPSIQRLSLSNENEPKRRRLERTESSGGASGSSRMANQNSTLPTKAALMAFQKGGVISVDSDSAEDETQVTPVAAKPRLLRRGVGGAAVSQKAMNPASNDGRSARSSSAMLSVRASPKKPAKSRKPSSSSSSSIIPLQVDDGDSSSEEEDAAAPRTDSFKVVVPHQSTVAKEPSPVAESDDDELPADEYVVQAILGHGLTKPIELPNHVGKKAVMLYKVQWEGWEAPTWEPLSSFEGAMDVVREYQEKVGMKESDRNA